jgi:dTDP-4-amino-4,6-dideoxygalactose transaminase
LGVGEGGIVYSANTDLISRIRQTENFGFSASRETSLTALNGKMSEYTAAIALSTLDVFKQKIKTRKQIYTWYLEELDNKDLLNKGWTIQKANGEIPYQFIPICAPEGQKNTDIIQLLASKNIEARSYFSPPCHQHQLLKGYPHTPLPVTEKISSQIISLPLWEEMTHQDVHFIIEGMVHS